MIYLFALLAGVLFNLAPCVLPALPLKIRALAEPGARLSHVAGILCTFLGLGVVSILVGSTLAHFSYGWFRGALAVVCLTMALALLGPLKLPSFGVRGQPGAFLSGVFTVLLGTSCSVPFLLPVIVWVSAEPWYSTVGIFFLLGLGFSSPLLLPIPLPKPGNWLHYVEKVSGVGLLAVAAWIVFGTFSFNGPLDVFYPKTGPRVVVVTADWCINCHVVAPIWESPEVQEELNRQGMAFYLIDWTSGSPETRNFLRDHGTESIPFAVVELPDGRRKVFGGLYTEDQVLNFLRGNDE